MSLRSEKKHRQQRMPHRSRKKHRQQRTLLRSQKKYRQQRLLLGSSPLQKRTLKKASITNPKCWPVSATTTATGTRWVMPNNLGTAQEASGSANSTASPPPWSAEETDACFIVKGQCRPEARLCLFRGRAGAAMGGQAAHPQEARCIAANIAKLPELLRRR